LERLDDLLKAFRSLEIKTLIISTDFTAGTRRLSGLTDPVLANRWKIYLKSGKNCFLGAFTVERRGDSFGQKVRLILIILQTDNLY